MKYIASCSFGKDSLATILLAKLHHEPLDAIVYARVMFDETTSAEPPEHERFIHEVAIPMLRSWGYEVIIAQAEKTFMDCFHRVRCKGQNIGKKVGFMIPGHCDANRDLKLRGAIYPAMKMFSGEETTVYVGIAADEKKRLERLTPDKVSLLAKYGYTEAMAVNLCKVFGLYSPMYAFSTRGGAFSVQIKKIRS